MYVPTASSKAITDSLSNARTHCSPAQCGRSHKVYVAVSVDLNGLSLEPDHVVRGLAPFVFKCGSGEGAACARRGREINTRRPYRKDPEGKGRPIYAGVKDWRILRCWPVEGKDYDGKVFFPWLLSVRPVRRLAGYTFATKDRRSGTHTATELAVMSEQFVYDGITGAAPHALHDEMLEVVRRVMDDDLRHWLKA